MTVRELMEALQRYRPDTLVVLAKDAEGNRFSPVDEVIRGWYVAETTYSGDFYGLYLRGENAAPQPRKAAVCLWPVN